MSVMFHKVSFVKYMFSNVEPYDKKIIIELFPKLTIYSGISTI